MALFRSGVTRLGDSARTNSTQTNAQDLRRLDRQRKIFTLFLLRRVSRLGDSGGNSRPKLCDWVVVECKSEESRGGDSARKEGAFVTRFFHAVYRLGGSVGSTN
jgi:hypothetical protein